MLLLIFTALFEDSTKIWNVNKLDNILNRIGVELPGVNTAYLYFGQWKATFAWHVEVNWEGFLQQYGVCDDDTDPLV